MNRLMTPRLTGIAALVKPGAAVIDVGSDHAYVPIYLLQEKKARYALATDVHDGPLARARENISAAGLSDKIQTLRADGLLGVDTAAYDTVIIAGMGGILISEILQNAEILCDKTLILQPMTAVPELRRYLLEHSFRILRESIVREEEKLYVILEVECGQDTMYSEAELLLGRQNRTEPLFPLYKAQTEGKLRKRLCGLQNAKIQKEEEIAEVKSILKELEQ